MSKEPRRKWERYAASVRRQGVERMKRGEKVCDLQKELGIGRSLLYWWRQQEEEYVAEAARGGFGHPA